MLGTKKKLFISGHGTYTVAPLDKFFSGLMLKLIYIRARQIFCNSNYTASEILKRVPQAQTKVVSLGTSQLLTPGSEYLKNVNSILSGRSPVILTVGALKKRKGQIYTLEAILILKKNFPNIVYVLIGDDADKNYKEKMLDFIKNNNLENHIIFITNVSDTKLSAWYHAADIFALNSVNHDGHLEGFGLVILEGYQFGLPAVGSRGCGIEDVIVDGETGYLSNQKDSQDIAEKIKKILESGKSKYFNACKEFAKKFQWENTAHTYLSEYAK